MNTAFPETRQELIPVPLNKEIDPAQVKSRLQQSLPFIVGAATAIAGTLLIRAWVRHSKNQEVEEVEEPQPVSPGITAKSIAFQLLPFATLFLKSWLTRDKKENAVATP